MKQRAFSIIELVVAVVILGVLAAMAIPRVSQGATDRAESGLKTDLAVLRTAIELYYHDHGAYPGQKPAGSGAPEAGTAAFVRQLTQYTDAEGHASPTPSETSCHGPYLEHGIPTCPVSPVCPSARVYLIAGVAVPAHSQAAGDAGWIYNCETGYIAANSRDVDGRGVCYDSY